MTTDHIIGQPTQCPLCYGWVIPGSQHTCQSDAKAIGPGMADGLRMLEMSGLRDENERLRTALAYYAKPRTFGKGEHSVFIDDSGVAKTALNEVVR